jgi:hypothetical protein
MSINMNGVDTWFEYADICQEIADKLDAFRRNNRGDLNQAQRNNLRFYAEKIREYARDIATIKAIDLLTVLNPQLEKLKDAIKKVDDLLLDVNNTKKIISGIADVFNIIVKILSFV